MRELGHRRTKRLIVITAMALLALPFALWAIERMNFRPGWNMYSPAQDVQIGAENAAQIEKQMPLLHDAQVVNYVNQLGRKLSVYEPNDQKAYVWQFHVVNTRDINAFALPGGYIFVNRGTIEAAQDESQLAGVIAHEEGHVVMRHGTHMASEMSLIRTPLSILGGFLGASGTLGSSLAQMGLGFGVNSLMLKNSRGIEAQADQVGTYTLYHAGYNPIAMAQFFQILQQKYPQQTMQFFSDHPNPPNRIRAVEAEIPKLGPVKNYVTDSPQFQAIKRRCLSLPAPPPAKKG